MRLKICSSSDRSYFIILTHPIMSLNTSLVTFPIACLFSPPLTSLIVMVLLCLLHTFKGKVEGLVSKSRSISHLSYIFYSRIDWVRFLFVSQFVSVYLRILSYPSWAFTAYPSHITSLILHNVSGFKDCLG
jgi:hypothetical protein